MMQSYYVQSGTVRTVVKAESARKAAMWAVHQVLGQVLPVEDDMPTADEKSSNATCSSVDVLANRVRVSQRGFDRSDATALATLDVLTEWHELVTTLDRLQRMLYRAA